MLGVVGLEGVRVREGGSGGDRGGPGAHDRSGDGERHPGLRGHHPGDARQPRQIGPRPPRLAVGPQDVRGLGRVVREEEEQLLGGDHATALGHAQPGTGRDPCPALQGGQGVREAEVEVEAEAEVVVEVRDQDRVLTGAGRDPPEEVPGLAGQQVADRIGQYDRGRALSRHPAGVLGHQGVVRARRVHQAHVHRRAPRAVHGLLDHVQAPVQGRTGVRVHQGTGRGFRGGHDHHDPPVRRTAYRAQRQPYVLHRAPADRGRTHRFLRLQGDLPGRLEFLPAPGSRHSSRSSPVRRPAPSPRTARRVRPRPTRYHVHVHAHAHVRQRPSSLSGAVLARPRAPWRSTGTDRAGRGSRGSAILGRSIP